MWFKSIREFACLQILKRKVKEKEKQRRAKAVSIDEAHYIAILYELTDIDRYFKVRDFVKYLKTRGKKVISLGFISNDEPEKLLKTQLEFRFFTKKDINWHAQPKCIEVSNFLEEKFDMLIDLCIEKSMPLKYVAGLSKARFKTGISGNDNFFFYDVMLNIESGKTLDNCIKMAIKYLDMINCRQPVV